ncbi:hypothetical protein [Camelimonas lactis]|uniref:Uncharacterized protein n=1 Tax=Camelimonas lactis TaxID=659006 RepID=A0A4R2GH91_9HYPH|nr:hypothetical protein [Camelimonas lactis]TCO07147.1 hypothetical protein EV666_1393 [Camelimonas lactis]
MTDDDHDPNVWIHETLDRPPLRIDDHTDAPALAAELRERLEALLAAHMLEPTPDGWRDLALALAAKHEPAFQIETPVDRESLGGRPAGWSRFVNRSRMKSAMRAGLNQKQAAQQIHRETPDVSASTAQNAMSGAKRIPDQMARWQYERILDRAFHAAAKALSRK